MSNSTFPSRTLCFGGSFNPIHLAHLRCSREAAGAAGFGRVLLIPTGEPPHKAKNSDLAPAADRLAMVRLAVADDPFFEVCDVELRTPGPHYTLYTARRLRQSTGQRVTWLIGADQFLRLPTWHDSELLLDEVDFVIMRRPGYVIDTPTLPARLRRLLVNVVEIAEMDISATAIRQSVKAGLPIDHLVPAAVAEYIARHGLWRQVV